MLNMRVHAKKRCVQRLGFDLNRADRVEITKNIRRFFVVEHQNGGDDIRYGFWKDKEMLFVYNAGISTIKTVFPLEHRLIENAREMYRKRTGGNGFVFPTARIMCEEDPYKTRNF